jgi:imidazolonepropionase-like amidohydrolase
MSRLTVKSLPIAPVRGKISATLPRAIKKRLARAIALGVPIAFGSDEYDDVAGKTRGQASLETLTSYVRQAATISAAALPGVAKDTVSITVRKMADIVAVPGNPLLDPLLLQRVGFVMKAGDVVRNDMPFIGSRDVPAVNS